MLNLMIHIITIRLRIDDNCEISVGDVNWSEVV